MDTAEATDAPELSRRVVSNATMRAVADDNSESLSHSSLAVLSRAAPWIAVAYVVGVACFLLRLSTALWSGHRLRIRTARVTDARLLKLIADQADCVKLKCVPVVAYCERVAVPTVVGVLRPMVLLPMSLMTGLTPDDFAAIIRHELAHVRRYDLWMNLLQRVIESLLFFHPVVWFISRRLSVEREVCCDDLVVSSGYEPMHYAGALLRMAESCATSRQPGAPALAATGDKTPLLERRIERLINWGNTPRLKLTRAGMAGLLMTLVSLIVVPGIAHTWAQAQAPDGEPAAKSRAAEDAPPAAAAAEMKPKHETAQALFKKWQDSARINGNIPGGALGSLARATANYVEGNPTDELSPKLAELLKRIDTSRDWTQADAVALLDDVTAIYANLPKWARDVRIFSTEEAIRTGQPLPAELEDAPWGEAQPNGLRAAWLLQPRAEQYRLGTALKSSILFHNAGTSAVVFRALTWNQSSAHKARDAKGAEIKISSLAWLTIPQSVACRLAPGEFTEVTAAGIGVGVGANKEHEDWPGTRVGSWIEAKEGDEVTFIPAPVSASGRWNDELLRSGPLWWLDFIADRLSRDMPLPDAAAERERLLDRAMRDLFGTAPTREETAAFVTDRAPNAMDTLANRLAQRAGISPFTGTLQAGETKFRVLAVDPDAAKRPRVATGPGRYTLGDLVRLVIVRKLDGKRYVNEADIRFFSGDPKAEPPGKPHEIKLPDGLLTWAIAWERDSTVLWVAEKGVLRSCDFTTPALVKETRIEPADITNVPEPLRESLRAAIEDGSNPSNRVLDVQGHPIAGAKLEFSRRMRYPWQETPKPLGTAVTDDQGRFTYPEQLPDSDTFYAYVTADGFLERFWRANQQVFRRVEGVRQPDTLVLYRPVTVSGQIIGADGQPLPDAEIAVDYFFDNGPANINGNRVKSDAEGKFTATGVPPANIFVRYETPYKSNEEMIPTGSQPARLYVVHRRAADGERIENIVLDLRKCDCVVEGTIVDHEGKGVAGRWIRATFAAAKGRLDESIRVKSDQQGRFRFTGLSPDEFVIGTETPGMTQQVKAGRNQPVQERLTTYITGRKPPQDEAARCAWGEPNAKGLVAGLRLSPDREAYALGDVRRVAFVVRNPTREVRMFSHCFAKQGELSVLDEQGNTIAALNYGHFSGIPYEAHYRLAPEHEAVVGSFQIGLTAQADQQTTPPNATFQVPCRAGQTLTLQGNLSAEVFGPDRSGMGDPRDAAFATGRRQIEIVK